MLSFNKIVNKLWKRWWKILFKKDIFEIVDPEKKTKFNSYVNKIIYRLKANNIIISIKAWVYIVPTKKDITLNNIDLLDKYYLKLLKKYISFHLWNSYYISWKKALELHIKDYNIPERVFIVNRKINKKIKVWNYEIIFKTISWKIRWKKINLYSRLYKYTQKKEIEWISFNIASLELSLLETSIISDNLEWIDFSLLNKVVKKYSTVFKIEDFYKLGELKFIMSFNRLKEISKNIDKDLYKVFLDIIKINWWLFIWEWLRWF